MPRTYTKSIQFDALEGDILALHRALERIGHEALQKAVPRRQVLQTHTRVEARGGVVVTSPTLDQALVEVREDALDPIKFNSMTRASGVGPFQVHIVTRLDRSSIHVLFSNEEAGLNEAISARMEREVKLARPNNIAAPIVRVEPTAGGSPQGHESVEPEPVAKHAVPESGAQWVKRTWRDHTATFIITLGGGLLVVAAAVWLGLQP